MLILKKAKGAKKAFSLDDIRTLIDDFESFGSEAFFAKAEAYLNSPQARAPGRVVQTDEFERKIKKLGSSHAEGIKAFVGDILEEYANQSHKTIELKKKDFSVPKIVQAFRAQSTEAELMRLAEIVTKRKSRSHASFR